MSTGAASDYLQLTLATFDHGLIGRTYYEARHNLLRAISDPLSGAAHYATELLGDEVIDDELPSFDTVDEQVEASDHVETSGPYFDEDD